MTDLHAYTDEFFEYIERGSIASASRIAQFLVPLLKVNSVLDVGCGRGAWLNEWRKAGVGTAQGIDGPYVQRSSLLIPAQDFTSVDLTRPFDSKHRYDLVTCLEVAEHLPPSAAEPLVSSLVKHSDRILFSAATPGQGGENHLNERPLSYWQRLFAAHDYIAFDAVRPSFRYDPQIEPWYKFNTVLYVRSAAVSSLPKSVIETEVGNTGLRDAGDFMWNVRRGILRFLPHQVVTRLARWNSNRVNTARRSRSRQ
jgi:2-polyprenyl-3-methyl-5-hydroxy-6-metoxy-1,4-benzoquinol methylase